MSSTFIPAASFQSSVRVAPTSTRLRLTRRGRLVLTSVVALPLAAVVAFAAMAVFIMRGKDEHDAYVISGENDVSSLATCYFFRWTTAFIAMHGGLVNCAS